MTQHHHLKDLPILLFWGGGCKVMNVSREAQNILSASTKVGAVSSLQPPSWEGQVIKGYKWSHPCCWNFILLFFYQLRMFPAHSLSTTACFLQTCGCEIRGRCGQEFTSMPVSDNLVSAQRDARHSHARRAPPVPGLFVSDFSFIHGCYQIWFTGCFWTFGVVYTLDFLDSWG